MGKFIQLIVRLIQAGQRIYGRKLSFLALFVIVFFGSTATLAKLDLLPEASNAKVVSADARSVNRPDTAEADEPRQIIVETPLKIEIAKINLSTIITNPTSTSIEALDRELLKGAVRYPTSAKLGEVGNIVLFGHTSNLPVVGNQAYKAFNGIQKLKAGDVVTVYSLGTAYTYVVRSVTRKSVNRDGVQLSVTGRVLTLITCDRSLGESTDRTVVTADFVDSHSISS